MTKSSSGEGEKLSNYTESYVRDLNQVLSTVEVTGDEGESTLAEGIVRTVALVRDLEANGGKVMLIGNGASAAIASHQAADFLKAAGVPACTFTDASLVTCLGNDLGYEHTFDYPVGMMGRPEDLLIAISSSGASPNVLNAADKARDVGCHLMTLSGFSSDNPLRSKGHINFYARSSSYGKVEVVHLAILHCVNDFLADR